MTKVFSIVLLAFTTLVSQYLVEGQSPRRVVHVFVDLCDNVHQGIVPVPARIGNGDDPKNNLYWGAAFGIKNYFEKSPDWKLIATSVSPRDAILERCIFKHRTREVYIVADAYRGRKIKRATMDFLSAASGGSKEELTVGGSGSFTLKIGGAANLVAYVGHNGLMDFELSRYPRKTGDGERDAIILACVSKSYFGAPLREAGANPLLWTSGLMAPEAYTLKSALDGWILNETGEAIRTRAAKAYNQYQRCGFKAARNLLVTGW